jgi:predicted enzyme related to lactoylglutathione lyase
MELNTARVFVSNIETAKQFYSNKLGLALKADGSQYGYCVFRTGSTELIIEAVPDSAPDEDKVLVGRFTGLSFTVQDVIEKYQELTTLGVPFTGAPEKQFWGGILSTFKDPSGNELQIVQQPTAA